MSIVTVCILQQEVKKSVGFFDKRKYFSNHQYGFKKCLNTNGALLTFMTQV